MKTKSILLFLVLLGSFQGFSQTGGRYLTVSYTSTPQSPKIVSFLREQIKDPDQLDMILGMLSDYKFHYVLHVDTKTARSACVLKSVDKVDRVQVFGSTESSIRDEAGNFLTGENFMQSQYVVKGGPKDLDWNITGEKAEIGKRSCLKATLRDFPDIAVWFDPELPVDGGPGYCHGLPGLVVKVETSFDETVLSGITISNDGTEFENAYAKLDREMPDKKTISLPESIKSKDNFLRQMIKKMRN